MKILGLDKDNRIRLLDNELEVYAKCKVLNFYDPIFKILENRMRLKYSKIMDKWYKRLGNMSIYIDNNLKVEELKFEDPIDDHTKICSMDKFLYDISRYNDKYGGYTKHEVEGEDLVFFYYKDLSLLLLMSKKSSILRAGYAFCDSIDSVIVVNNTIRVNYSYFSCFYIDINTYEVLDLV